MKSEFPERADRQEGASEGWVGLYFYCQDHFTKKSFDPALTHSKEERSVQLKGLQKAYVGQSSSLPG